MGLTVNTNLEAMNAARNLNQHRELLATSMQRLSSGLRINSSADDVAGYAISERMQGQVNGLNQATQNIADAVSLAQTGQGALNDIVGMLQRIRSLAVEYANGTTSEEDKEAIETEAEQLTQEIERVTETTTFNGVELLNGGEAFIFQVGANEEETVEIETIEIEGAAEAKRHRNQIGRRSDQRSDEGCRPVRCRSEPHPVHRGEPGSLLPEPLLGRQRSEGRQHGYGNDQLHQGAGPAAGWRGDSRPGQPPSGSRPEAPPVVTNFLSGGAHSATAAAKPVRN